MGRVLMTGATGFVGQRVARALVHGGAEVVALTRPGSASRLPAGTTSIAGDLLGFGRVLEQVGAVDAVVHCAMEYDKTGAENWEADQAVVGAAAEQRISLIYTSSLFDAPELDATALPERLLDGSAPRLAQERRVLDTGSASAVIRLAFVWGDPGENLWCALSSGPLAGQPGDAPVWPLVHVDDVADLFLRVANERASGVFHATDGEAYHPERLAKAFEDRLLPANEAFTGLWRRRIMADSGRSRGLGWSSRVLQPE